MVIQNAGREGDDHRFKFVTNAEQYAKMVGYLVGLSPLDMNGEDSKLIDPEKDDIELTHFYGHYLNGNFEKSHW